MTLNEELKAELEKLARRLNNLENGVSDAGDQDGGKGGRKKKFLAILKGTCKLVRRATAADDPQLPEIVETAQKILNQGVNFAYGDSDMFDFLPSWAHDAQDGEPLIRDREETDLQPLPHSAIPKFAALMNRLGAHKLIPDPWNESMKRHPNSSPLARFRPDLPTLTATPENPRAMCVYDARCEVTSDSITSPIRLQLSRGNSCLAMNAMGGYKNRTPVLDYYILGDDDPETFPGSHFLEVGLADIAYHMALDESRRLIFLGDDDRIKSYAWGTSGGDIYKKPLPTHTLDSDSGSARGPIAVLPNGTVVRAGEGSAAFWSLDGLQTHGEKGSSIVGVEAEFDYDTMRDDPEEIEQSMGSEATSQLAFADNPNLKPSHWCPLIQSPASMLCTTSNMGSGTTDYDCFVLDLEHGGKISNRFLGHGGVVPNFSVSASDPQVFLSACNDGFARLYDLRRPLPVLTFDACGQNEFCDTIALAHPDGIPTVFTGTAKAEQIKVWDARARTPIYELATGNNAVVSLAWDPQRNSLYAATETHYMDRNGYHHDYRRAKISKRTNPSQPGESVVGDDDLDDDDDDFEGRCWPKGAMHSENSFGYTFDAGNHRIYRYQFKENPNPLILPEYGDASMRDSYW